MRGITVREAAERLLVHPHTIRRWLKEGKIKGWKVGGRYRIDPESLQQIVKGIGGRKGGDPLKAVEESFGSIKADPRFVIEIASAEELIYEEEA